MKTPATFQATSFDALVHEFNLSGAERDKARIWFLAGLKTGLRRIALLESHRAKSPDESPQPLPKKP